MNKNITLGELLSFIVVVLAFIAFTIAAYIYGSVGAGFFLTVISLAIIVVGLDKIFDQPIKGRTDKGIKLPTYHE